MVDRRNVAIALLIVVAAAGIGYAVTADYALTGETHLDAHDGPEVVISDDLVTDVQQPFPSGNTIDLRPNGQLSSDGPTHVRVDQWGSGSDWTEVSEIEANNELEIDIDDRQTVSVEGDADELEFGDIERDEGHQLTIEQSGTSTLVVDDLGQSAAYDANSGELLDIGETTAGETTFEIDGSRDVEFGSRGDGPDIDDDTAEPVGDQSNPTDDLGVEVSSDTGSDIEVEFELNGEVVGSDTIESGDRASVDIDESTAGSHDWSVTATDVFGDESSSSYEFGLPDELTIRNETTTEVIDDDNIEIELTIFGENEVITRTTDDGTIDMTGLPAEMLVIQAEADGYVTRQTIIQSIAEQQDIYLLPEEADQVTTQFTLDDPTGQFNQEDTRVYVEKPITRDGATSYETIVADEMGSQGYSTVLEQDQRYRITVEDIDSGTERRLGPYVTSTSEQVTLSVDQLDYSFEDDDLGYRWDATYQNETEPSVQFAFDSDHHIEQLTVDIIQSGGSETQLLSESHQNIDSVHETAIIPEEIDGGTSTWIVEWEAEIAFDDGVETISGSTVVGPDQMPIGLPGVSDSVLHFVSVFLILAVGGLFSAANVEVGAVVVSLFAGVLWFVGFLPGVISGMLIALALLISVMWMAQRTQGPR